MTFGCKSLLDHLVYDWTTNTLHIFHIIHEIQIWHSKWRLVVNPCWSILWMIDELGQMGVGGKTGSGRHKLPREGWPSPLAFVLDLGIYYIVEAYIILVRQISYWWGIYYMGWANIRHGKDRYKIWAMQLSVKLKTLNKLRNAECSLLKTKWK